MPNEGEREREHPAVHVQPVQQVLRGTIGTLTEYKMGSDWCSYEERMDQYFIANYIEEDKKVPVLLTVIGEQAYEVLKGLCDPDLPKLKSYRDLCKLLRDQFSKKVSVFKERIEFYELRQFENESIKDFYVRLKNKAIECKFGAMLNDILRDRFVSGLRRGPVLDRVCEEEHTARLEDIFQVALKKEAAIASSYTQQLHKLSVKRGKKPDWKHSYREEKRGNLSKDKESGGSKKEVKEKGQLKCNSCGEGNHSFDKCKYKTYTCKVCKKVGHLAKVCYYKQNHYVETNYSGTENQSEALDFMEMYFITENGSVQSVKVEMLVNNKPLSMELDSGAGISVIPEQIYKCHFSNRELKQTNIRLKSYDGNVIIPKGEICVPMQFKDKYKSDCRLVVIKNGTIPLLGRDLMHDFDFSIQGPTVSNINSLEGKVGYDKDLKALLAKYDDMFKNELGLYKYERIQLKVNPEAKPIFCKPRPIPFLFKELVDKELEELEQKGVISPVENAEWGTPLVPVLKDSGKLRLCSDYKITVVNIFRMLSIHSLG